MSKIINFLIANPSLIKLLKEKKISLVGVSAVEHQAIIEAFNEPIYFRGIGWRGAVDEQKL